jgi:predicted deacetylase
LYVPDFHGGGPAHADARFADWCRAPRPYRVEWFLHGYFHQEQERDRRAQPVAPADWFRRALLTDGEGEFLALRGRALEARVQAGLQSMARAVGSLPVGFVAPAWLYHDDLLPVLQRLGMRFTESHFHVFDLQTQEAIAAPVITWASRSGVHRLGSRVCASVESRLWRRRPVVRVALHPGDFDHPGIVASIARTIEALQSGRRVIGCQVLAAYSRSSSTIARLVQTPKLK